MRTKIRKCYFMSIRLATGRKLENAPCHWRCGQDARIWLMGKHRGGGAKGVSCSALHSATQHTYQRNSWGWELELYAWCLGTWRLSGGSYHCPSLTNWISRTGVGTSQVVQWLRFCALNAEGLGWIPGWGTKIPHALTSCTVWQKKITKKDFIRRNFLKKNRIDKDVESFIFS